MQISGLPMIASVPMLAVAVLLVALSASAAELAGSEWRPVRIGADVWADATEIFVRFENDGRLVGHAGCNRFMGGYALDGDGIEITPLATTRMACSEPVTARERLLLTTLESARRFVRNRTELTLADQDGTERAFLIQTDWD